MLKFQAVKQTKTYAEIVEQISKLIEQGELKPGERLPSERSLSSALNIGRQSLREALSVLEAIGLLEVRHGIGTFVKQDAISHLTTIPKNNEDLINPFELLEARRVIEVELVSLAAKRATELQIQDMEKALEALKENEIEGRHAFDLDRNVHLAFARGANNQILYRTMLEITEQMSQQLWIIMKERSLEVIGRGEKYHREHETIFNAIKSRDHKMATHEMLTHLKNIERAFLQKE
ncbi:FadR/GntR family transcriptional regulator [Pelosinus sp. sgz500959]|uniref:FadR/GntR family transcriptional regulator n=1 Tax=Pelosinus sp. sgz500959 TaxID=3242472 RepID=UPI00366D1D1D